MQLLSIDILRSVGIIALAIPPNTSAFGAVPTNGNGVLNKMKLMASRDVTDANRDMADVVNELMDLVGKKEASDQTNNESEIRDLMTNLSSKANDFTLDDKSPSSLFDPLVGYYNVSYTLTSRPNDNPVGGKWTRGLWTVKRTMQHILPPVTPAKTIAEQGQGSSINQYSESIASKAVAQVVNAIRLELLWGFVGIWVLLRGDAVPLKLDLASIKSSDDEVKRNGSKRKKPPPKLLPDLSDRTVKAYFDRPRIGVSLRIGKNSPKFLKRVLTLGPTSAVVLDTPYADSRVRLGKGGTSGSQFVFTRLPQSDVEARDGWKWVLEESSKSVGRSLTKMSLVLRLGVLGLAVGILSGIVQQRWTRVLAGAYAVVSGISILGLARSTGGIETDGDTYMEGS